MQQSWRSKETKLKRRKQKIYKIPKPTTKLGGKSHTIFSTLSTTVSTILILHILYTHKIYTCIYASSKLYINVFKYLLEEQKVYICVQQKTLHGVDI